jgi:hypothetical protein
MKKSRKRYTCYGTCYYDFTNLGLCASSSSFKARTTSTKSLKTRKILGGVSDKP